MRLDEKQLVRLLQQGDPRGIETLYGQYGDRIYRFCLRLCGKHADAEDLTQEVFVAAFCGQERFMGRSAIATWLYRIALYRWTRLYAGCRSQTVSLDSVAQVAGGADPAQVGTDRLELSMALNSLSADLYAAFVLVKVEGLTYREAAEVLQIPQGTVQSRVHDAARAMRKRMHTEETPAPAMRTPDAADTTRRKGGKPSCAAKTC